MTLDQSNIRLAGLVRGLGGFASEYRHVWLMFIASRALIIAVMWAAQLVLARGYFWHPGGVLTAFLNWDAERWYLDIARYGYFFRPGEMSSIAFFPAYPMLVRLVSFVFHDFRVAGLVTSNACFLIGAMLLHRLVRIDYDDRRLADIAVTFLMFSPAAFFFSSAYTESTFLMLAVLSMLAAIQRRWWLACLAGMCLTATRNVGIWIGVALFAEYVRQCFDPHFKLRELFHPRILLLGLVPLGLGSFVLYCHLRFDDAFAFLHAGEMWNRRLVSPFRTIETPLGGPLAADAVSWPFLFRLYGGAALVGILLWAVGVVLRLRLSYLLFSLLLIVTYLCSNSLEAMPRYLSVVFPLFIVVAIVSRRVPALYEPLLAVSIGILTLCSALEATGYWIT